MDDGEEIGVRRLLEEHFGDNVVALATDIGMAPSTVWRWREGLTKPRARNLARLRDARRRENAKRALDALRTDGGAGPEGDGER